MKHLFYTLIATFLLTACKKEENFVKSENEYIANVKAVLRDSLLATDFSKLDFEKGKISKVDSVNLYLFRVPFVGKDLEKDFILVKTDKHGQVEKGKIIHLEGGQVATTQGSYFKRKWDGNISISSLNRNTVLNSSIVNGYITAFHTQNTRSTVNSSNTLPEIFIVGYANNGSFSLSDWISLLNLLNESASAYNRFFFSLDGTGGGGSTGGGGEGSNDESNFNDPPIEVDLENQDEDAASDLIKFLNCFNNISDAGSDCSIEIFADVPVDTDPNRIFDFNSGSPGHTFIQLRKTNGSQSTVQNLGFYPVSGFKTMITTAPVDGKFVDNGGHEYNASLKMNLTPANFQSTLNKIISLQNLKYDLSNWNCTDWALSVFNTTRSTPLDIPLFVIPGNYPATGTSTAQGLFMKLKSMKTHNNSEAMNITIDVLLGWVANSQGACN